MKSSHALHAIVIGWLAASVVVDLPAHCRLNCRWLFGLRVDNCRNRDSFIFPAFPSPHDGP